MWRLELSSEPQYFQKRGMTVLTQHVVARTDSWHVQSVTGWFAFGWYYFRASRGENSIFFQWEQPQQQVDVFITAVLNISADAVSPPLFFWLQLSPHSDWRIFSALFWCKGVHLRITRQHLQFPLLLPPNSFLLLLEHWWEGGGGSGWWLNVFSMNHDNSVVFMTTLLSWPILQAGHVGAEGSANAVHHCFLRWVSNSFSQNGTY